MQKEDLNVICEEIKLILNPDVISNIPLELFNGILEILNSPTGKKLIREYIDQTSTVKNIQIDKWLLTDIPQKTDVYGEEISHMFEKSMEPLFKNFDTEKIKNINNKTDKLVGLSFAKELIQRVGPEYKIPVQALEVIDNIKWDASAPGHLIKGGPRDGVIAAGVALAISVGLNTTRYRDGKIRWDDALDNVVGDVLKAGITGVIVSALATSLPFVAPITFGLSIIFAPTIYAIVDSIITGIYKKLLGGEMILAARAKHYDYVRISKIMQNELWPKMREMKNIGNLIEIISKKDTSTDQAVILDNARQLLSASYEIASTNCALKHYLEKTNDLLAYYLSKSKYTNNHFKINKYENSHELEHLFQIFHERFWFESALHSGFEKPDKDKIINDICRSEEIYGLDNERQAMFKSFLQHLYYLEEKRSSPEEPLCFEVEWKCSTNRIKEEYIVKASDIFELTQILSVMTSSKWPWDSRLQNQELLSVDIISKKELSNKNTAQYNPSSDKFLNPFYPNKLFTSLQEGKFRLFQYENKNIKSPWPNYIVAEATEEDPDTQCKKLKKSLQILHPIFNSSNNIDNLKPVDYKDVIKTSPFTIFGVRVFTVRLYTATYSVESANEDEIGNCLYSSHEGYFQNQEEAQQAFKSVTVQHKLIGVRPGSKILSDSIRKKLQEAKGGDLFSLQNQLLGRLAEGLIALDQVANLSEARIAKLAGTGVILSWWWMLTGYTRRELVKALSAEAVRQALRVEIMEALLQVQRLHILSHPFFHDTIYYPIAKELENKEEILSNEIDRKLSEKSTT